MQTLIKTLFKDNIIYIAIGITLFIGYFSLVKFEGQSIIKISNFDKFQHAFSYFILTLSWLLAFKDLTNNNKLKYTIALGCVFYGIVIEVLQATLTNYRTASFLDILANLVGIIIALLIFKSVYKKFSAI